MDLNNIIIAFTKDIIEVVRAVMSSSVGVNLKVHRNTLTESDVFRNINVVATHDGDLMFDLMLNNYIEYIESGRYPGVKFPPVNPKEKKEEEEEERVKFPPVKPIEDWARKHGIPTDNSTIFLIRRAISRDGIDARPVMDYAFKEMDKVWSREWSDELFNKLLEKINEFFK